METIATSTELERDIYEPSAQVMEEARLKDWELLAQKAAKAGDAQDHLP